MASGRLRLAREVSVPTLNIRNEAEKDRFIRAILPEFLRVVNPRQSGLLDALFQSDAITVSDNSSLSGKDVCTRKDQARKLLILLGKKPYDVFMEKVAPELCSKFLYIIPEEYRPNEATDAPPTTSSSPERCLRREIKQRIRPAAVADLLFHKACIDLDTYSTIVDDARRTENVWTTVFDSFLEIPPSMLESLCDSLAVIMEKYHVALPADLKGAIVSGSPCTCGMCKEAPSLTLGRDKKIQDWLEDNIEVCPFESLEDDEYGSPKKVHYTHGIPFRRLTD